MGAAQLFAGFEAALLPARPFAEQEAQLVGVMGQPGQRVRHRECGEASASSAAMAPFRLDDSANASCTGAIAGLAEVVVVMLMACSSSFGPICTEPAPAPGRSHP
ncbi:hypothetical protein ABZ092_31160 [Streptomyces bobili]|uniref:hypothetical protein n=1 Tax=Streptomyces bobili TaxID=67280 RepID=UPI0033BE776A